MVHANKLTENAPHCIVCTRMCVWIFMLMHQSILAVSSPPLPPYTGNSGIFSHTVHPGNQALALYPITPGHSPHSIVASINDQ